MPASINTNAASGEANAYLTLAEAATYFSAVPNFYDTWNGLTSTVQNAWIIWGTKAIDRFSFLGFKFAGGQALEFPRMIEGILQEARYPVYSASTIAFVASSPPTITDSDTAFVTEGFLADPWYALWVYGSMNDADSQNNGVYSIASVAAGTITLDADNTLYTEAAGNEITLIGNQPSIPQRVKDAVCEAIRWGKREIGSDDSADDRLLESVNVGGAIAVKWAGATIARLVGGNERAVKDLLRPYIATNLTAKLQRT